MNLLERLLGANWRTTLSGWGSAITSLLTMLAIMPYELGELGAIISPEWKEKIAAVGLIATFLLRVIHSNASKDAKVSGIGTDENPTMTADSSGRSRFIPLILLALASAVLCACATTTGSEARDRAGRVTNAILENAARHIGQFALMSIQNAAAQAVDGRTVDWSSAASQGLWTSLPKIVSGDDVKRVIDAWAGPAAPTIIKAAEREIEAASTPGESRAVAVAIASGLDRETPGRLGLRK